MKYAIIADNHFCLSSSVIQKHGDNFSTRLENQKDSLEWVASLGLPVIHLGDFFDKDLLCAEEVSCFKELTEEVDMKDWIFLEGNHGYNGGYSMSDILPGQVVKTPMNGNIDGMLVKWLPFNSTAEDLTDNQYDIIFGHIGVEGIPFGAKGFDPDLISKNCRLFLNGHLHNKNKFRSNCWNIGSLTAQNFSDDCMGNEKGAMILDTRTLQVEFIPNPHAFNFYKMREEDALTYGFPNIKTSCISVTCTEAFEEKVRERLKDAYYLRVNVIKTKREKEAMEQESKEFSVDYLNKFRESFIEKQGESAVILNELAEVCQ